MANYVVPKELLLPFIPFKTGLDFFGAKTFVSLVGFMFLDTRILGLRVPYHINFEEVNLRFYVKYNDHGNWKRGTVFIREIVPRYAISFFANLLYGENYSTRKMNHCRIEKDAGIETNYEWKFKDKWNRLGALTQSESSPMRPGSEEEFITEHYWGYTKYSENKTCEYEVSHPRWEIFKVLDYIVDCDFSGIYGNEFSFLSNAVPSSVFMAKGSEVKIYHKRNLV